MINDDSELIQRTLEGDQQAFALLVEKYQEQVHTLAWQKIGDFTSHKKLHKMFSSLHIKNSQTSRTTGNLQVGFMSLQTESALPGTGRIELKHNQLMKQILLSWRKHIIQNI